MSLSVIKDETTNLTDQRTTVIAIGPWDQDEFALVQSKLEQSSSWFHTSDGETATDLLSDNEWSPEFILIAQLLPGDVSQEQIELLRQIAPLAQIVIITGSWCEGELRTGNPPSGVLRMYWHEFLSWWPEHQAMTCLDGPLASRGSRTTVIHKKLGTVAIHTPFLASFETFSSTLALAGFCARWFRKCDTMPEDTTVGIWDGGQLDPQELTKLQAFGSEIQTRNGKLIVLLDFPRKQHIEVLQQLGCHAVLGKPYVVEELFAACTS